LDAYPKGPDRRVASNILLSIITVVMVGFVLRLAGTVVILLLVSGFLAYLMDPLVGLLRRLRLPLVAAVALAALLFFCGLLVFGWILYHSTLDFARAFPRYQRGLLDLMHNLLLRLQLAASRLSLAPLEELQKLPVSSILLSALRSLASGLLDFIIVFVFALLFLVGKHGLARKLLRSFPHREAKKITLVLLRIDADLRKYIGVKSLASLLEGVGIGAALALFRVEFAVVLGFLAFILRFIPYAGSAVSMLLPFLIAVVQFGSLAKPLWIVAVLLAIDALVAYVFEPKALGVRLNISVPIIFVSLLIWGWLWGAPGVLLAVPLTTSVKIIMEDIPGLRHFALLLEKTPLRRRPREKAV
jgi:AI-2 transport protein TqsA